MTFHVNDNSTIRDIDEIHVDDNGIIRQVQEIHTNDNGVIRLVYQNFVVANSGGPNNASVTGSGNQTEGNTWFSDGTGERFSTSSAWVWGSPTTSGIGSNYFLRYTTDRTIRAASPQPGINHQLNVTRSILQDSDTFDGTTTINWQIRASDGTTVLDSGTFTILVNDES